MAVKTIHYKENNFDIHYTIIHPKAQKDLVILHGWGSNKEIMQQAFQSQLSDYRHIYIDMPGFGKSNNPMILDTAMYAEVLASFLKEIDVHTPIMIGHSFGGKVATLLKPSLLVLLSSAGIPIPKPFKVRVKIALFKVLKPFGLHHLRKYFTAKDVSNMDQTMYETFKNVVNEDFTSHFRNYAKPALLFWGKADTATPLWSGEKMATLIEHSSFFPLEGDHFFFLNHIPFITQQISKETHDHA